MIPSPFEEIQKRFPILQQKRNKPALIYLDNAATTQKPQEVLDALLDYYTTSNANTNRSAHHLSDLASYQVATVRRQVAQFINAATSASVIFTAGTTASLNLVANTYGAQHLKAKDEIIICKMAHHSHLLPWQKIAQEKGAVLRYIPLTAEGHLDQATFASLLNPRTKIVALTYVSNVLGTINPLKQMVAAAHAQQAIVVVDAAQAPPHLSIDVQDLDCDFLAFSGHKAYGPTGVGVLYGKKQLLDTLSPYQVGGGMVQPDNAFQLAYEEPPYRFEAGTLPIASIVGLGAAIAFLKKVTYPTLQVHEQELLTYTTQALKNIPRLRIWGAPTPKVGIISFTIEEKHPLDIGVALAMKGIAVRTGHHCAAPLMAHLGIQGTVRISFALYNTLAEIDQLIDVLVNHLF